MYYNPITGQQLTYIDLKRRLNSSLPVDIEEVGGWFLLHEEQPEVTQFQTLEPGPIELKEGKYYKTFIVKDVSEAQTEYIVEQRKQEIRYLRNRRLQQTDYMIMPDYPISAKNLELVTQYRQALRDLPAQEGFPWLGTDSVPWPTLQLESDTNV